ncbi:2TM domain-containing protein [Nonomuraea sp. NPDC050556]|uniref:2TM domain-containing protein n=1 Tax=Nonomuraea sp. NPDC050556 TaxID=3364369 RepID=UPI0037942805
MKSEPSARAGLRIHIVRYVVVWWLFTPRHFFWPLYSLLAWGIGLAFHVRAVSAPSRRG